MHGFSFIREGVIFLRLYFLSMESVLRALCNVSRKSEKNGKGEGDQSSLAEIRFFYTNVTLNEDVIV